MSELGLCSQSRHASSVVSSRVGFMKQIKNIAALAGVLWAIQLFLFILLFASAVTHLIVQCFVVFGVRMPENSVEQFFTELLKILTWPTRLLVSQDSFGKTPMQTVWLTGLNSLLWGMPLRMLFFYARNRLSLKRSTPA